MMQWTSTCVWSSPPKGLERCFQLRLYLNSLHSSLSFSCWPIPFSGVATLHCTSHVHISLLADTLFLGGYSALHLTCIGLDGLALAQPSVSGWMSADCIHVTCIPLSVWSHVHTSTLLIFIPSPPSVSLSWLYLPNSACLLGCSGLGFSWFEIPFPHFLGLLSPSRDTPHLGGQLW